ncbi:MAG: galactokinase [Bacilli bacterium]|nr:galactokinase [Bacilli bacterium]
MILKDEARELYKEEFGKAKTRIFFSHGRVEVIGNHTDHQGGLCLVGGIDLGLTAAVAPNKDGAIRVVSKGFAPFLFHLDELKLKKGELGTTIGILKGILVKFTQQGYNIGGFTAAICSDLPAGSGLSSSAAVEALFCQILNVLYNDGKIGAFAMAKISQFAENVYFGKPCGLLDQIGVCYGGLLFLDFKNPDDIKIEPVEYTLPLHMVLVNTGGSHAGLTAYYASIPADMFSVAHNLMGIEQLGDADMKTFLQNVSQPCSGVTDVAKMRAQHFYDECQRVKEAKKALEERNCDTFLQQIRLSQYSSQTLLNNTFAPGHYDGSPQQAIDVANGIIGHGGCRIVGGGFAGSILCFVYPDDEAEFKKNMAKYYGKKNVVSLHLDPGGAREVE